ncbi:MAG: prenyltransferase [Methanolobus sp.]|nr:prenyltransferase [Methanolobus sp.]
MEKKYPSTFEMIRGHGLIAMLVPLLISTSMAFIITGQLNTPGLLLAALVGFSIHISMNVYNDIYDTKQGSDTLDSSKSFFSGGSAVLVSNPELEGKMFTIARAGLLLGFLGTLGLMYVSEAHLWLVFIFIFLTASFLSKYYTARPFKFAYRGLGEIVVWFGFGPLAILLGAAAQGVPFHPLILSIMPVTGLSTLLFSWSGEMVDMPYDMKANKRGLVLRIGLKNSIYMLFIFHMLLTINVLFVSYLLRDGWILVLAMIPYLIMLPKIFADFRGSVRDRENVLKGAKMNFFSFLVFSLSIMLGFIMMALNSI